MLPKTCCRGVTPVRCPQDRLRLRWFGFRLEMALVLLLNLPVRAGVRVGSEHWVSAKDLFSISDSCNAKRDSCDPSSGIPDGMEQPTFPIASRPSLMSYFLSLESQYYTHFKQKEARVYTLIAQIKVIIREQLLPYAQYLAPSS